MKESIKIAYIGGGSRLWARSLMSDLALEKELSGEVFLYDIDFQAAKNNSLIANMMMKEPAASHQFTFYAVESLEEALVGADFVLISILPGTFDEMEHYVHDTQKYGIHQTVGDTVGPAGIFRGLIMMPMYEEIARAIEKYAPSAWVLNFTNPMTLCVDTLYHVFPKIKAFGNCHEVFFVQRILSRALKEKTGLDIPHHQIQINPLGINHFTWINYATYKNIDIIPIYNDFVNQYHENGLIEGKDGWLHAYPFGSAERVKLDLFQKYHIVAAAGDRHLVEFLPHAWYLRNDETAAHYKFHFTPVEFRKGMLKRGNESAEKIIRGEEEIHIYPSGEEGIAQIKALLGYGDLVTNVNMPNQGQIPNLELGGVVETNALFTLDQVYPIYSGTFESTPKTITDRHIGSHQLLLQAFDEKDLNYARQALYLDFVSSHLNKTQIDEMFDNMILHLGHYLDYYRKGESNE